METNFELLRALKEEGLTQRDLASLVGEHESVTSRVVNGVWRADERRKRKYARALRRKVEELFPR